MGSFKTESPGFVVIIIIITIIIFNNKNSQSTHQTMATLQDSLTKKSKLTPYLGGRCSSVAPGVVPWIKHPSSAMDRQPWKDHS